MRELDSKLALLGPTTEIAPRQPGYRSVHAIALDGDDMLLAYIKRDSHPDRGSHRIKVRNTAASPSSVDAGIPADLGNRDAGPDNTAITDLAQGDLTADLSDTSPPPLEAAVDLVAKVDLAADLSANRADASSPTVDAAVAPDTSTVVGQPTTPQGCSCEVASPPSIDGFLSLLPLVLILLRRRQRND
jgi:MYXO-CTERM domain-containing protein